jgi:indole-3-glycerol phosphate synthase
MSILDQIVAAKREELAAARRRLPEARLAQSAAAAPPTRDFAAALRAPGLQVIAEIKRASPSAGTLRQDFDPVAIARSFEGGGAAAVSVLTDADHFHGSLEYLRLVRGAVRLPLLRKDFTLATYHLHEARCAGADAVLLIVAILEDALLRDLIALASELQMAALVEIHDPAEGRRAIGAGARLLGINNRNLETFVTDLAQTQIVLEHLPSREGLTVVSESGIQTAEDLRRLATLGVDAALVGEHLMRAPDPGEALGALLREHRG